ncbi:MAG: 23S rRNA (guanosine(2251)-2'-O)-methyltransferase RlmB [Treponema sp.]|nr:23S rRNA (guanosine(2251)-2'-O)-methyltransferase RlmB [Treponema sp.]
MKVITGFHAIEEKVLSLAKVKSNPKDYQVFYSKAGPRVKKIIEEAKKNGVTVTQCDDKTLDAKVSELNETLQDHRGIILEIWGDSGKQKNLVDFDEWLKVNGGSEKSTVVILDRVTDPHNVGAIIRSCDQFGAGLVILPENNASTDIGSEVISRSSAGASAWVPVSIVTNLVRTVEKLKDAGYWIYGADAGGENLTQIKFPAKTVLVMGSEGSGMSHLLEEKCDSIVSIPTCGKIDSLNVSVAAGVLLYAIYAGGK